MDTIFNNVTHPQIDASGLFSNRHEKSFVVDSVALDFVINKIKNILSDFTQKTEFLATTYFYPVLAYEPKESCIVRFRQRAEVDSIPKTFKHSKIWLLSGSGSLEVKFRDLENLEKTSKMSTFIPDDGSTNIYKLFSLAKNRKETRDLVNFINTLNNNQYEKVNPQLLNYFKGITPDVFIKISDYLTPYATRVNFRNTFEARAFKSNSIRITIEEFPSFYIYPICADPSTQKYIGDLSENPDRCKIEIKSATKALTLKIHKAISASVKNYLVPGNKYTKKSYYQMILDTSRLHNTIIDECPGLEIETKAILDNNIIAKDVIKKLRNQIIHSDNSEYKTISFDTEKVRGEAEKDRTIMGWQDKNGIWNEVVTIIRLTKDGSLEHGFKAVLKWKANNQNEDNDALIRKTNYEYLNKDISNTKLLKEVRKSINKNIKTVGILKKLKHRLHLEDKDGRNFIVSIDESIPKNNLSRMYQLEVEYVYTVHLTFKSSIITVQESCLNCADYIINILRELGINCTKTQIRKIDYLASLNHFLSSPKNS